VSHPRIYADFNGLDSPAVAEGRLAVALDTLGTVHDLSNAQVRLRDGLRLTVWDESDESEDLEADGIARYDAASGKWWADLGAEGYRYIPAGIREPPTPFLCIECRTVVEPFGRPGQVCPECGTSVRAVIAPPSA